MLDGGESAVAGSAAVCAADCVADLVCYAAEGERLVGLVKTRRLMAMQKQQRAKAGMKPSAYKQSRKCAPFPQQALKTFPHEVPSPKPVGSQFANCGVGFGLLK